ncbi:MAG: CRISPR-associated helicase/endonuclease Cas3, partial [Chloroflexaceae bacterium]
NREGRLARGRVVVFESAEDRLPQGVYKVATNLTRTFINRGAFDLDNPAHIQEYFRQLIASLGTKGTDNKEIQKLRAAMDYPEIARRFRLIDEDTDDVIVAYGDEPARAQVRALIAALQQRPPNARQLLRRLQPYLVSVRAQVARRYRDAGWIAPLADFTGLGVWHGRYDPVRGLVPDDDRSLLVF